MEDVLHAAYGRLSLRGAQGAGESPSDRLRGRAKGGRRKGGGLSSCFFYLQVYFPPDFVVLVSRFNEKYTLLELNSKDVTIWGLKF